MAVPLVDERTKLLERRRKTRLVLETVLPHLRVHPVVGLFAVDLRRKARHLRIVGRLQRLDPLGIRLLVEPVARDRPRPLGDEPQLDKRRAAVLVRLAVEGELVLVLGTGTEVRLGAADDVPLQLAVAGRVLDQVGASARYVDVSVPERAVVR